MARGPHLHTSKRMHRWDVGLASSSGRGIPSMSGSLGDTSASSSGMRGVAAAPWRSVQCACPECAATAKACMHWSGCQSGSRVEGSLHSACPECAATAKLDCSDVMP